MEVSQSGYACLSDADLLENILISSSSERVGFFRARDMYFGDHLVGGRSLGCYFLSEGFGRSVLL